MEPVSKPELTILQSKIKELESQIVRRRQRSDELIDDRLNQLLEESIPPMGQVGNS